MAVAQGNYNNNNNFDDDDHDDDNDDGEILYLLFLYRYEKTSTVLKISDLQESFIKHIEQMVSGFDESLVHSIATWKAP